MNIEMLNLVIQDFSTFSLEDLKTLFTYYHVDNLHDLIRKIYSGQHFVANLPPGKIWEKYKKELALKLLNDRTALGALPDNNPETGQYIGKRIEEHGYLPPGFEEADPSRNKKYLEWIVKSYIDGGIKRFEDLSRVQQALLKYEWLLRKKIITGQWGKDINGFCGLSGCETGIKRKKKDGLEQFLKNYTEELKEYEKEEEIKIQEKDIERVYEDDEVRVIIPKTQDAACKYGKGTQWCTAATKGDNMFDYYNKEGPLYIIMGKKDGKKYQLHMESRQYMDEEDNEVVPLFVYQSYPGLKNVPDLVDEDTKIIMEILDDPKSLIKYFDENPKKVIKYRIPDLEHTSEYGLLKEQPLLMFAFEHELGLEFAQKLVDAGASVDDTDDIDMPILYTVFGDREKMDFLIKNNVDLNQNGYDKQNVLFYHVQWFNESFLDDAIYLIENGLDPNTLSFGYHTQADSILSVAMTEASGRVLYADDLLKLAQVMVKNGYEDESTVQRDDIEFAEKYGYKDLAEYLVGLQE